MSQTQQTNGTISQARKNARNLQFWAWRYDATGYNKTSAGPVHGGDAYEAAGEARRLFGAGRYLIREQHAAGRIVIKYC